MDDLISRQAAIAAILNLYPDMPRINVCGSLNRWREKNEQYIECEEAIKKLPSVKWKKGKWVRDEFGSKCSCCGLYAYRDKFEKPWESNFCPNCGADMREEIEDIPMEYFENGGK